MKTLKTLLSAIVMAIAMILVAPAASAQTISKADRKTAAAEVNKTLPQKLSEGFYLSKITYDEAKDLLSFSFTMNPEQMGVTLAEAKKELENSTMAEWKEMLGGDMAELMKIFGCDVEIILILPDNYTKKLFFGKQ